MLRTHFSHHYAATSKNAETAEKLFRDIAETYNIDTEISMETFCTILRGMETVRPIEAVAIDIVVTYAEKYGYLPKEEGHVSYIDIISDLANNDFQNECEAFYEEFVLGKFNVSCARNVMIRAISFIYGLAFIVPDGEEFDNLRIANNNLCKDLIKIASFIQFQGIPLQTV